MSSSLSIYIQFNFIGKYECQACGYIYDESVGNEKKGIAPGTPFNEIEKFRCPQCGANKKYFVADVETLSGEYHRMHSSIILSINAL